MMKQRYSINYRNTTFNNFTIIIVPSWLVEQTEIREELSQVLLPKVSLKYI